MSQVCRICKTEKILAEFIIRKERNFVIDHRIPISFFDLTQKLHKFTTANLGKNCQKEQ